MNKVILFLALAMPHLLLALPQISISGAYKGPTTNNTIVVTVDMLDSETATEPIWSETFESVTLSNHAYHIQLGSQQDLFKIDFTKEIWLKLSINGKVQNFNRLESHPKAIVTDLVNGKLLQGAAIEKGIALSSINDLKDTVQFLSGDGIITKTSILSNEISINIHPDKISEFNAYKGPSGDNLNIDATCTINTRNDILVNNSQGSGYTCIDPESLKVYQLQNNLWYDLGYVKGEQGEKGDTGDKGIAGEMGIKGEAGDKGPRGSQGPTGAKGTKGDKGEPGELGATGEQGLRGEQGERGDKGEPFKIESICDESTRLDLAADIPQPYVLYTCLDPNTSEIFVWSANSSWENLGYIRGDKGDKGDKGEPGDIGPVGNKGDKGDTGDKGLVGNKGDKGDIGDKGPKGNKGDKGDKGADIKIGESCTQIQRDIFIVSAEKPSLDYSCIDPDSLEIFIWTSLNNWKNLGTLQFGQKGDKGDIGNTGLKGPEGDTGDAGIKGPIGDVGNVGAKGPKGDTGNTGAKGAKGDVGSVGAKGPKGDVGSVGAKGPKGDTGNTGTKGPKGDTGAKGPVGYTQWVSSNGRISNSGSHLINRIKFKVYAVAPTCTVSNTGEIIYLKASSSTTGGLRICGPFQIPAQGGGVTYFFKTINIIN